MDLIFLHGAPAVGKLTVARALEPLVPARLIDNHATIDLARIVFDFGAPGFWTLVAQLRLQVLQAAAASDLTYLVTTGCYIHPDDLPLLTNWEDTLHANGGRLRPVYLRCSQDVLFKRIEQPNRAERRKLTSREGLADLLSRNDYAPVPRADIPVFDTDLLSPEEVAEEIVQRLDLQRA